MRRTEVRPMFSRRAISDLLAPARWSFWIFSAWRAAVIRPAQALAALASVGQAGTDTFPENLPLEFREHG
jgi:hypothetical protein